MTDRGMKTYLEIAEIERMEAASGCVRDRLLNRMLARTGRCSC
jgi:hypothetical protein